MGKRSSKKRILKKAKPKVAKIFNCPFCNHNGVVDCTIDKKQLMGAVNCRICGANYQMIINYLTEPIDVYSEWIDECHRVNQVGAEEEPRDGGGEDEFADGDEALAGEALDGEDGMAPAGELDDLGEDLGAEDLPAEERGYGRDSADEKAEELGGEDLRDEYANPLAEDELLAEEPPKKRRRVAYDEDSDEDLPVSPGANFEQAEGEEAYPAELASGRASDSEGDGEMPELDGFEPATPTVADAAEPGASPAWDGDDGFAADDLHAEDAMPETPMVGAGEEPAYSPENLGIDTPNVTGYSPMAGEEELLPGELEPAGGEYEAEPTPHTPLQQDDDGLFDDGPVHEDVDEPPAKRLKTSYHDDVAGEEDDDLFDDGPDGFVEEEDVDIMDGGGMEPGYGGSQDDFTASQIPLESGSQEY